MHVGLGFFGHIGSYRICVILLLNKSSSLSFEGKALSCIGFLIGGLLVMEESWVFVK